MLSGHHREVFASVGLLTISLIIIQGMISWPENNIPKTDIWNKPFTGKRPFLSAFRANVNVATAICILAVDFSVFPRRFSKAETFGTGLMDIGVGAFIISNALVSQEARGKYATLGYF